MKYFSTNLGAYFRLFGSVKLSPVNLDHFKNRVLLLCLVLSLVACDRITGKAEEISFFDNKFAIMKPASWSIKDDLNDAADLQVANYFKEAYLLVLIEAKADFDGLTLLEHSKLTRVNLKNNLNNFQEAPAESISINGREAIRIQITGSVDKIKIKYWHVTVDAMDHYAQLVFWSLPSRFEDNKADFRTAMNSFKVKTAGGRSSETE